MRRVVTLTVLVPAILLVVALLGAAPAQSAEPESGIRRLSEVGTFAKPPAITQVPHQVIVQYRPSVKEGAMRQAAVDAHVTMKDAQPATSATGVSFAVYESKNQSVEELIGRFKNAPGVVRVLPNYVRRAIAITPNDPLFAKQWGLNNIVMDADIDAPTAWDLATGVDSNVVVACIDTGVDYLHADLAGNMWVNPGEIAGDGLDNDSNGYVDDVYGIDVADGDSDPMDVNGHGTHVAGIMAARGNNGIGVTGVDWGAKIMALRFLGADASGTDAGAIASINYAIDMKLNHGVNIVAINASWGGEDYDAALRDAIQAAGDAGIVFAAGAGNSAANNDDPLTPFYPAAFDSSNIIAVGATDSWDRRASFSNYGASTVDLFAPGVSILSTYPSTLSYYVPGPGDPYFDDMEGAVRWTHTGTWAITEEAYNSPTHAWSDSPNATYNASSDTNITSNAINLSALAGSTAILGWSSAFDLEEGYDYVQILVSGNGGATWTSLGYLTGYDEGNVYNAVLPSTVLTSSFKVRFLLHTDQIYNYDGIYIDDVGVSAPLPSAANTGYQRVSGTSMATPFVTGTVALMASIAPDETVAQRIAHILNTADPVPGLAGKCASGGRLNTAAAVAAAAPVLNKYEQTDGHISRSGTWVDYASGSASGGSYGRSSAAGSSATVYFYGTRLDWIAMKGTTTGSADVYLDDVFQQTVNLAASSASYQVKVWSATGLPLGPHRVRISYNAGNPTGKYITLDRVDVLGSLTYAPPAITGLSPNFGGTAGGTSVNITGTGFTGASSVTFDGVNATDFWVNSGTSITATTPAHAAGTVRVQVTTLAGSSPDTANDDFTYGTIPVPAISGISPTSGYTSGGTSVTINGTGFSGVTGVTFGGTPATGVSVNSTTRITAIAPPHTAGTVRVQVTAAGGVSADTANDDFTYVAAPVLTRVDSAVSGAFTYTGSWSTYATASAWGGSYRRSSTSGASFSVGFNGTRLDWIATKGTTQGKADVYVDNIFVTTVDLYRSSVAYQQNVFTTGLLPSGTHTVRIVRNGTSVSGRFISLDAVDIAGTLASATLYQQSDPRLLYSGTWSLFSSSSASGGSYKRSSESGASAVINFTGTRLDWIATRGTTQGKADVYVDAVFVTTVDLSRTSAAYQQTVFSTGNLSSGSHIVRIVRSDTNLAGKYINIDAVNVWGTLN